MKLLTVAIPCYNSQEYMARAIDSLLTGQDDIEIIIINDGSKDKTKEIADDYVKSYPSIVRAIHKENGGHGSGVNMGLKHATGLYYKVVDSDDWVDEAALKSIIDKLKEMVAADKGPDMFISNYVYEKVGRDKKKVIDYNGALPKETIFTWDDIKRFKASQNIIMHSVIYKTQLIKDCNLELPEHTFYVDNIFVYVPLPYVKTMYYLDVDLYRYFIGRDDQSVNEANMIRQVDQQLQVTKIMLESHELRNIKSKKLQKYMVKYLVMMLTICSVLLVKEGSEESLKKKDELWNDLKEKDSWLFSEVRSRLLGKASNLSGKMPHKVLEAGYNISKKIYNFN